MADDGAFTIPPSVLEAAPNGTATALFSRERRDVVQSGGKSIQTIASKSRIASGSARPATAPQ
jgi:hypothetical protein